MKRFFARASRHVGFQIGAVLLLLFVGTALVSIFWTPLRSTSCRCVPS